MLSWRSSLRDKRLVEKVNPRFGISLTISKLDQKAKCHLLFSTARGDIGASSIDQIFLCVLSQEQTRSQQLFLFVGKRMHVL